ncbi:hypothetical protein BGZ83_011995 [Gryganskiella cystojenkinii]|nr:hypothetical protein BGZ83_011995 [Gryganskiella cystojenkinii]
MSHKSEHQHEYGLRDSTVAATAASEEHQTTASSSQHQVQNPKQQGHGSTGQAHSHAHGTTHGTTHTTHTPASVHVQLATGREVNLEHPVHPEHESEHGHHQKNH